METTVKPHNAKRYLEELGWLQNDGGIDNNQDMNADTDPNVVWEKGKDYIIIGATSIKLDKVAALGLYLVNFLKD